MATNAKTMQRWPPGQEKRRVRTIENAQDAIEVLNKARKYIQGASECMVKNPHEADLRIAWAERDIADAISYLRSICLDMTEAKQGTEN